MKVVAIVLAALLAASAVHAAVADRRTAESSDAQASVARPAHELLVVHQGADDAGSCSCECVATDKFDAAACSSSGSCTAMPCPMPDGKTNGKTCCSASATVDAGSDAEAGGDAATSNRSQVSGGVRAVDRGAKLTPSSRLSYRCRYYYRYRCFCRYFRIGSRLYRRCSCLRYRYRVCRWVR